MDLEKYQVFIGLEVHIELETKAKMFCSCQADHFAKKPNTQVCPVCLGLPGALPYPNQEAIKSTLKLGLVFNSKIASLSKFDRKHYFYPDLPKGYQISQYDLPLASGGHWFSEEKKKINIIRIHLEEDTAKLIHEKVKDKDVTLVDFNRSGVPLLELVTAPDFSDPDEVLTFLKELQLIVKYLKISSADMEKGSMRLEANVSLQAKSKKRQAARLPDYKVELKNINSFRFLGKAIRAEIQRQIEIYEKGGRPKQETRGYNEAKGKTFSQRTKEEAQDYRYFPEPDIPPITINKDFLKLIKNEIPEMPREKLERLKKEYQIKSEYAWIFVSDQNLADYFEKAVSLAKESKIKPKEIADLLINKKMHLEFPEPGGLVRKIMKARQRKFLGEKVVLKEVGAILGQYPQALADYNKGKTQVIGFLIGQVQKKLKNKANVETIITSLNKLLKEKIN